MSRPLKAMKAGKTLRVVAEGRFRILSTLDGLGECEYQGECQHRVSGSFADVIVPNTQTGPISFTLLWLAENRWEGKNYDIEILPES